MQTAEPTTELRENIHENEAIQWVVRPHALGRFLGQGLGAVIGGAVLGVFVAAITAGIVGAVLESSSLAVVAGAVVFLLMVLFAAHRPLLRYLIGTTEYAATDERIVKYDGISGRTLTSIPLEGIQDAEYSIGSMEKMFDVGTVSLDTERGYDTMSFPYTPAPAKFTRAVSEVAQQSNAQQDAGSREYTPGTELATTEPVAGLADNLYPDEELLWVVRPDKTTRLLAKLPTLFLRVVLSGAIFGGLVGGGIFFLTENWPLAVLFGALAVGYVFLSVGSSAAFEFLYGTSQYAATDRRIIQYKGTLGKRLNSIPLVGIQDAEYSVSSLENWLDIGTVTLDTGLGYRTMSFSYVAAPAAFAREISQLAASDVANRTATRPSELDVGDGISPESATDELSENIPDEQVVHWVVTPDHKAKLFSTLAKAVTLQGSPFAPLGALSAYLSDTTEYALTDSQLVEYSGRFGRELSGVPVEGITDAEYDMDYIENRFAVGNVTVHTDRGYEQFRLEEVPNPVAVAREISEVANAHRVAEQSDARAGRELGETVEASTSAGGSAAPTASARKRCRECDSHIDALSAFCPDCGTSQPRPDGERSAVCGQCHEDIADGDSFCRHCGTETPVQRAD